MMSQSFIWVVCVGITLLSTLAFAQDLQPEPMPEPTAIYTCGENYQPVDLAFDGQGKLYSSDAQLLSWLSDYATVIGFKPGEKPYPPDIRLKNHLYQHDSESACSTMFEANSGIFGLTEGPEGEVCFSYEVGTPIVGPLETLIACIDVDENINYVVTNEPITFALKDLNFSSNNLLLFSQLQTPAPDDGLVGRLSQLTPVDNKLAIRLGSLLNFPPHLSYVSGDGTIFFTIYMPFYPTISVVVEGASENSPTTVKISPEQQEKIFANSDEHIDMGELPSTLRVLNHIWCN
jgi:hypothetical protein